MQSKGQLVCSEAGQGKFCATIPWKEKLKEMKSDLMTRIQRILRAGGIATRKCIGMQ